MSDYDRWKTRSDLDEDFLRSPESYATGTGTVYPKRTPKLRMEMQQRPLCYGKLERDMEWEKHNPNVDWAVVYGAYKCIVCGGHYCGLTNAFGHLPPDQEDDDIKF